MDSPFEMPISRRTMMQGSAAAGAALMLDAGQAIAATAPAITKPIPSSGERLPVIGIGTNAFGVTDPADIASRKAVLDELPRLGGKVVDTARGYGESEVVIGRLIGQLGNRDRLFLATKTPMRGEASKAAVDESFKRLGTDRIDLFEVHNFHELDGFLPILNEYKQAKKIRYVGVTCSTDDQYPLMIAAMGRHRLDFIQVDYSIDNRGSDERILPMARDKGIAVLNNMPLGGRRGSLMPKLAGKPLPGFVKDHGVTSWAQLLLKYNVSHPAITAAIPGTTRATHLRDNQQAGRGRLFDAATRKRIEDHWATLGIA